MSELMVVLGLVSQCNGREKNGEKECSNYYVIHWIVIQDIVNFKRIKEIAYSWNLYSKTRTHPIISEYLLFQYKFAYSYCDVIVGPPT